MCWNRSLDAANATATDVAHTLESFVSQCWLHRRLHSNFISSNWNASMWLIQSASLQLEWCTDFPYELLSSLFVAFICLQFVCLGYLMFAIVRPSLTNEHQWPIYLFYFECNTWRTLDTCYTVTEFHSNCFETMSLPAMD